MPSPRYRPNKFATVWIELRGSTQKLWLAEVEKDDASQGPRDSCDSCYMSVNNRTIIRFVHVEGHRRERLYHLVCAQDLVKEWVAEEGKQIAPGVLTKFWAWFEEKAVMDMIVNGDSEKP